MATRLAGLWSKFDTYAQLMQVVAVICACKFISEKHLQIPGFAITGIVLWRFSFDLIDVIDATICVGLPWTDGFAGLARLDEPCGAVVEEGYKDAFGECNARHVSASISRIDSCLHYTATSLLTDLTHHDDWKTRPVVGFSRPRRRRSRW